MKKFLIDGRFLSSLSTGVDRYAWEIVKELDKICDGLNITLLVPASVFQLNNEAKDKHATQSASKAEVIEILNGFQNIRVKAVKQERFWTQGVFAMHARFSGSIPVNLCNEVAVLAPKGITALHDVCYAEDNDFFPDEEREWFMKIYGRIKKHCSHIITVSEFSKERIVELLGIPGDKITVAGNGWQHFNRVDVNEDVFKEHPEIKKGEYYFTLASANKNKNVAWVVENATRAERNWKYGNDAEKNSPPTYVIGGKNLDKVFDFSKHKNIVYVGFLADEDAKAYMKYCKAFVFPSFYEGFGIPPLEAASTGARIIVSDRASLPEICEDAAIYIDPENPDVDLNQLMQDADQLNVKTSADETQDAEISNAIPAGDDARQRMLDRYSWKKSAGLVCNLLRNYN